MDSGQIAESEQRNVPQIDPQARVKLSDILASMARDQARERISVGDLLAAMGDRAFGALMFIFAMPNVLPTPPGTSGILGTPLVFLAAQLAFGRRPWLPKLVANRSMSRADFGRIVEKMTPWLERGERLLAPRATFLVAPPAEYLVGALCLVLAIILVLPIPLGNMLPAFAICLLSLGILERDGFWIIVGALTGVLSMFVVSGVIYAMAKAALFVFANAFA